MVYKTDRETRILFEDDYKGRHFVIVSYGTHPCAYVEVTDTKYAYLGYDELEDKIRCHGGLTYADNLDHVLGENNRWFIGWDYAHAGDYMGYDELFNFKSRFKDKKWTTEEIYEEVKSVIEQLEELL